MSGAALLVSALGLFTFPEWVVGVVGLRIKPDTWNVFVGSLFTFFGAYGIVSSLLAMIPIMWAAVVADALLLVWFAVNLVFQPSPAR